MKRRTILCTMTYFMSSLSVMTSCSTIWSASSITAKAILHNNKGRNKNMVSILDDDDSTSNRFLNIRGGASKTVKRKGSKNKSSATTTTTSKSTSTTSLNSLVSKYKSILPLTRIYITIIGIVTLLAMALGDETAQALLALDPLRTTYGLELWRPITAASFLGPPSIGWLMNTYYLFEYGSSLERAYGTAQHIIFLLTQLSLLVALSLLLGQPFFANSMITSMLHVLSRSMPRQKVKWLIFTVPYWSLPYGLMAGDVLQSGSATSALPHIMGIVTGHVYFFHKFVWPKTGGEDWLVAPDFLVRRFDPDAAKNDGRMKLNKALGVKRKRGQGMKLSAAAAAASGRN